MIFHLDLSPDVLSIRFCYQMNIFRICIEYGIYKGDVVMIYFSLSQDTLMVVQLVFFTSFVKIWYKLTLFSKANCWTDQPAKLHAWNAVECTKKAFEED